MSYAFRPIGVYLAHSHTFETKSGQNEEGLDLGSSLEEGVLGKVIDLDWKMALLMGQAQRADVGELVIAAEEQLGLCTSWNAVLFMWLAAQSSEHYFLDH